MISETIDDFIKDFVVGTIWEYWALPSANTSEDPTVVTS